VRDWRPSRWPLFSQFFAILLATVMAVQLLNTALLLFMPTPTAEVNSLKRIATALRSGTDSGELYRLRYWTRLPPGPLTQHDLEQRAFGFEPKAASRPKLEKRLNVRRHPIHPTQSLARLSLPFSFPMVAGIASNRSRAGGSLGACK
jgi:hypothetical protein